MKRFLPMQISPLLAVLFAMSIVYECSAEAPEPQRRQRGPGASEEPRSGERRRAQRAGGQRDPAQMVARMMQQFDQDGDSKLNEAELTKLLTSMRERRGRGMRSGDESGRRSGGKAGQRGRGQGEKGGKNARKNRQRRRGGGNDNANPGGDIPNRPAAE